MQPQYQTVEERRKELGGIYQPMYENINKQIAALPEQYAGQKSSLEQAKENAFRDITKGAARGGMFFTGFTPREQARYLGEKYLPGLQNLTAQENQARLSLLGQMSNLQSQERAGALSYLDQLTNWQRADAATAAAARASGSGGGGFGGFDFGLPTDTGTATTTATPDAAFETYKKNTANDLASQFAIAKSRNDFTTVRNTLNSVRTQLQKPNLSADARNRLNYQLSALQQLAQEYNINLDKLTPSRAAAVSQNKVVQTAKQTAPYLNPLYAAGKGIQAGYNWIFGSR